MMARGAMMHGAFHSIAGQKPVGVIGLLPELTGSELASGSMGSADNWLGDRLSLFGRRYGEFALLSDATTATSRAWQFGGVSRLMGIILRGARYLGDDLMFEPSGPNIWNALQNSFSNFLEDLRLMGAFGGFGAADSYSVTCDRTTMTQNDIDSGRIVASVMFNPAFPVERITVSLALTEPTALPQKRAA
jgi:phage tail sheath protein FI